jgi:hypothetical protein
VLIDEAKGVPGNPWGVTFARLFDMSNDSGLFRTAAQLQEAGFARQSSDWVNRGGASRALPERYVPLYEAKMIHQFDHRWGDYALAKLEPGTDPRQIPRASSEQLNDPSYEVTPRYWVPLSELDARLLDKGWSRRWLMGWRDITSGLDERTVIAAAFPRIGVGNKIPLILPGEGVSPHHSAALIGSLSSLSLDFCARQKIGGTTLNFFILFQFPVLPPSSYSSDDLAFIVPRVVELTFTSHSMAPFAQDLGYDGPPFAWDEDRRAHLRAKLDAWYARAYGLTRDELRYVLDPGDVKGPEYPSETFRVLKKNEIARFGEYRTRVVHRLV